MSYGELISRADCLSADLTRLCGPLPAVIAIQGERSHKTVTGALAALSAGYSFILIDNSLPEQAQHELLARVRAAAVINTESDRVTALPGTPRLVEDAAYLCATSGTTGASRLVCVPVTALDWLTSTMARRYALESTDVVLQASATGFDVWHEEVWPTLSSGATLLVRPRSLGEMSFVAFGRFLIDSGVTVCNLPSSYFAGWVGHRDTESLPAQLRLVVAGSEPLAAVAVDSFVEANVGGCCRLLNAYGLTETTVTAMTHDLTTGLDGMSVPIGTPLPGVEALVVGDDLAPVPTGTVGRLLIGGRGLSTGYVDDPLTTAERFLTRHFEGMRAERWLVCGDLARIDAEGRFHLTGRSDDQVKIAGRRVSPLDIEAFLQAQRSIVDARVVVLDDTIHAFVSLREGVRMADLSDHVTADLPAYLRPHTFTPVSVWPTTPNGKVDKRALLRMVQDCSPVADLASIVMRAWQMVLPEFAGDPQEDFFHAGGGSLQAAKVIAELRRHTGRRVMIADLYDQPTFGDFVEVVAARDPNA